MTLQELHKWVAEIEKLTGGDVKIGTHGVLFEVSVSWRIGDQRFSHREAFTPIEMVEAHCGLIRSRLDFVTSKIRRYMEAPK
jgi:hypothetical protein